MANKKSDVKTSLFTPENYRPKGRTVKHLLDLWQEVGFEVKLKPFIQRSDGSTKGDWDVGITLDVMEYAPQSDVVVLASGDGDFDLLLHKIRQDYDVLAEVYGVRQLTAKSLIDSASKFIAITDDLLL